MTAFFSRLFNIRPHEWSRLLLLYLMSFLFYAGSTWGETIIEASFLQRVGVKYLSLVFFIHALLSIISTSIYSAFADRIRNDWLLIGVTISCVLSLCVGIGLLETERFWAGYLLLQVLARVIRTIFVMHWWTYVNGFYDTQSAKRIVPVLTSSSRIAIIFSGLTVPVLTAILPTDQILWVWIGALLSVCVFAWLLPRILKDSESFHAGKTRGSYLNNIREGYHYVTQSNYLRWMAVSTLILVVIFALLNYQSSKTMLAELDSVKQLSIFIGQINAFSGLIMLPVQLFLFSRIVSRTGVGNANLIYPVGTVIIAGLLIGFPGALWAAALAYFDRTAFRFDVRETANNLLYNAVPLRVKGRTRAFIEGGITPIGLIISSITLILLPQIPHKSVLLGLLGVLVIAYLGAQLVIRRLYSRALLTMLEQEDLSVLASMGGELPVDSNTISWLKKRLSETTNGDLKVFIARIISEIGGSEAQTILEQLSHDEDTFVRLAVIELIAATSQHGEFYRSFWKDLLNDPDPRIRRAALAGLEQAEGEDNEEFLETALDMLTDLDMEVRAQAIPALIRSGDFAYMAPAIQELIELLNSHNPETRRYGLLISSRLGDTRAIRTLLKYLKEPSDTVRMQALSSIEVLLSKKPSAAIVRHVITAVEPMLHDPSDPIRMIAVRVLALLHKPDIYRLMLPVLGDPSHVVRETAVSALVSAGTPMIPDLKQALNNPALRKMASVALTRIRPSEFSSLLDGDLYENLRQIYQNHARLEALVTCGDYPGIALLQSTLRRQNQQILDEVFYLLTAIHGDDKIRVVWDSLKNENLRVRANAAEALESLTTPQTAQFVSQLFDPEMVSARLIGTDGLNLMPPDAGTTILDLLHMSDPWLRAVMTYALAEIGASQTPSFVFTVPEITAMVSDSLADPDDEVLQAAQTGMRLLARQEDLMLSAIEKVIFLKEVPFFQHMTVDQLKVLAAACEEESFNEDQVIYHEGDVGGALYVVVNGKVALERAGQRQGSSARLATIEPRSYFGEMTLFDNSPRSASAVALQQTLTLQLRREPLIALTRQYPDLSLELIHVLSARLREAEDKIATLTKTKPRELHKVFDKLE